MAPSPELHGPRTRIPRGPLAVAPVALAAALASGCGGGIEYSPPPDEGGWVEELPGMWTLARRPAGEGIGAIGYADGWQPAQDATGVVLHDPERAQAGLNLYSSGHGPEAILMDMDGRALHSWHLPYGEIPGAPPLDNHHQDSWRRVRLLEDGSLLAIYGGRGLVKIDRDSNLVWHLAERVHHDITLLEDGRVLTLTRRERSLPALRRDGPVIDDEVLVLTPAGQVASRLSLLDCLLESRWAPRLLAHGLDTADILHVNSLTRIEGNGTGLHPAFLPGRLLCCARNLDLLFVVDPQFRIAVWVQEGDWGRPHDPRLLDNGRLLLFDNLGASSPERGPASRVLEFDPVRGEVVWEYVGAPPRSFFSLYCGTSARLEGGNTLITESGAGRAFELDREGQLVWDFRSPHRAGERAELVAALFEVQRLDPASVSWLGR